MSNPPDVARGIALRAAIEAAIRPDLHAGAPFPATRAIAAQFGLSPVRAAAHLMRCRREWGMVTRRVGRGLVVVGIGPEDRA